MTICETEYRMDYRDAYAVFAPYYRTLLTSRGHFVRQTTLVREVLARTGMVAPRILDAACGTGDVAITLLSEGVDVTGKDGSQEMLAEARRLAMARDCDASLEQMSWENAGKCLAERRFDLIYLLGNSLAHARRNAIPGLLTNMTTGLNAGGVIAFDFRPWVNDGTGRLVEPGRAVGVTNWLGRFEVDGHDCWIDEVCSYEADIQHIHYSIHHCLPEERSGDRQFGLQYTPFAPEDVKSWLTECGFREESIAFIRTDYWPYVIALAKAT